MILIVIYRRLSESEEGGNGRIMAIFRSIWQNEGIKTCLHMCCALLACAIIVPAVFIPPLYFAFHPKGK